MPRAEKFTVTSKTLEYYSDFLINFSKNPLTGSLSKVVNEDSIKQSLRNLVLTSMGERFYRPLLGSKIKTILFDPIDTITEDLLRSSLMDVLKKEARAKLINLEVVGIPDRNEYDITIFFECIHFPEQILSVNVILKRIR